MKKLLTLAALLSLLIHQTAFPQSGWFWQNPLPQGNFLNSVSFVNSSTVYVSGSGGTLLKSTNSGADFSLIQTGIRESIGVYFINEITGFSLSGTGILKTTTGGTTWRYFPVPTDYGSSMIQKAPNGDLYILKGKYIGNFLSSLLYKSTDLGETWSLSLTPAPNTQVNSFQFVDQNTGYAVGKKQGITYSKIYKTTNSGTTWDSIASNFRTEFKSVYFTSPNTGYISTYTFMNKILKTTDGCLSWDTVYSLQSSQSVLSIKFFDAMNGYLMDQFDIVRTTNAGMNWETILTSNYTYLRDIDNGLGIGPQLNFNFIFQTSNSGNNWTQITQGFGYDLYGVTFINENTGFTVGSTKIFKTTNSGSNWTEYNLNEQGWPPYVENIMFVNDNTGYAGTDGGRIAKTTDCGASWQIFKTGCYDHNHGLSFPSADTGYAVTKYGFYLKTTNGGVNWINFGQISGHGYGHIVFVNNETGFAGGANSQTGIIRYTKNGGLNWVTTIFDSTGFFYDVCISDANKWFACGSMNSNQRGIIARSTDAGLSWSHIIMPNIVTAIHFPTPMTGYASIDGNLMYKTTNGGESWFATDCINSGHSNGMYFLNENTGWAVGNSGNIIKTTTGGGVFIGIQPIKSEIPESFILHQNYPNPFNPATKIKFEIPSVGAQYIEPVKIIIYDILGREITTLINEQLRPGVYEVNWNATNYPSGVYFYRLLTSNYSETRKMVLLK